MYKLIVILKEINCELEYAKKYIEQVCNNLDYEKAKEIYASLAKDEINHAEKLYGLAEDVVKLSDDDKEKHTWEYLKGSIQVKLNKLRTKWQLVDK